MNISALTLAAALAVSGAAFAESPFVGFWKMDVAKSSFTGDTMTYTKTATGYRYFNGGPVSYDFDVNGRPYKVMIAGRTTTWTNAPDGGWDTVFKIDGTVRSKAHKTLSADGSTLTTTYVEYLPNGTTTHESDVYRRVSGGPGLVGKWKSVKADVAPDSMTISRAGPTSYKIAYPMTKVVLTAKLDGTPVPVAGPTVPPGAQSIFKKSDTSKWTYSNRLGGKVFAEGIMKVSSDGSTLTDTSWVPGKEDEKSVEVYDRR
jgi:hypothetical protein